MLLHLAGGCARSRGPAGSSLGGAAVATPGVERAQAVLRAGAQDLDATVRARALATLVQLDDAPGGGDWAARGLWDPSAWVQRETADALASRLPEPASVQALQGYVVRNGVDPLEACLAARQLAAGSPGAVQPDVLEAIEVAARQAAPAQAQACWLFLAEQGQEDAALRLREGLARPVLRLDVDLVAALATTSVEGVGPALADGLDRLDDQAEIAAGTVLLGQAQPQGEGLLRATLAGRAAEAGLPTDWRQGALEVLDQLVLLDTPDARDLLEQAARGADPMIGATARLALLAHGRVDERAVRSLASQAQGDAAARPATDALAFALHAASVGLRRHPDATDLRRAAARLHRTALTSLDFRVQLAAADVAAALGDGQAVAAMLPWMDDDDVPVVLSVAVAAAVLQEDARTRRDDAPPGGAAAIGR